LWTEHSRSPWPICIRFWQQIERITGVYAKRGGKVMKDLLLGIDVGTTGSKSAIFNTAGALVSVGQSDYETRHEHAGWAEQNPDDWWNAVCGATVQAVAASDVDPDRIAGVAVSSQAPAMLPLDRQGRVIRPALIWMDRRAEQESRELAATCGEGVVEQITGNRPDPFYVASKILWFRKHEPGLFAKTSLFVQVNGYIAYRLCGVHAQDPVQAALLQLQDYDTGAWSETLCSLCGVEPSHFPPVFPAHLQIGEVTAEAAEATGLCKGTPVVTGTVDGSAAALEAGAVSPGTAAEMTGTSTVLLMPAGSPVVEPAFIAIPHCVPERYLLLGAMAASGGSLKWFRDQFGSLSEGDRGSDDTDPYDLLTGEASDCRPGSGGVIFLPYMMGERSPIWHTNARGVFYGLTLSTTRGSMIRAILEGVCFALRHNVEHAYEAGIRVTELRSVGGGTRSDLWNQIKADVLGIPILLPETSVGAPFGDAVLAGRGVGIYDDVEESLASMVSIKARYEPREECRGIYDTLYALYRRLYEDLKVGFDHAAEELRNFQ
jgi:xylulokinase